MTRTRVAHDALGHARDRAPGGGGAVSGEGHADVRQGGGHGGRGAVLLHTHTGLGPEPVVPTRERGDRGGAARKRQRGSKEAAKRQQGRVKEAARKMKGGNEEAKRGRQGTSKKAARTQQVRRCTLGCACLSSEPDSTVFDGRWRSMHRTNHSCTARQSRAHATRQNLEARYVLHRASGGRDVTRQRPQHGGCVRIKRVPLTHITLRGAHLQSRDG